MTKLIDLELLNQIESIWAVFAHLIPSWTSKRKLKHNYCMTKSKNSNTKTAWKKELPNSMTVRRSSLDPFMRKLFESTAMTSSQAFQESRGFVRVFQINFIKTKTLPSRAPSLHANDSESGSKDGRFKVLTNIIFV